MLVRKVLFVSVCCCFCGGLCFMSSRGPQRQTQLITIITRSVLCVCACVCVWLLFLYLATILRSNLKLNLSLNPTLRLRLRLRLSLLIMMMMMRRKRSKSQESREPSGGKWQCGARGRRQEQTAVARTIRCGQHENICSSVYSLWGQQQHRLYVLEG